jgi:hypothetical protein
MSAGRSDLRSGDGFELLCLLFEPVGVPPKVVGGGVELMLIGRQRCPTQLGSRAPPRVDVAVPVEPHDGRRLDGLGEPAQVVRPLSELVRGRVHHREVGARSAGTEMSEVGELHRAVGDRVCLVAIVGDEQRGHVGISQQHAEILGEAVVKFAVETGERFVEEDDGGLRRE